ncbi:cytochrome P450 [Streptomyces sp. TLI_171]|uniref:cytochrome P450 family protein n=1 Tax=Streptomyces sp. TLI_171 TaxID=1938859 RepID=UPI000C17CB97|nr:cytochrome P450 [Streptomyces sp. TLI_171]RKE18463.1 cytochrome P450 [Streptomyces sp. TLI_171]
MPSSSSESRCPFLDPTGSALHEEAARLRAQGPAVLVELPGGVRAWSVTRRAVIQALTTDPRVSRDHRRHWPGAADVPEGWVLGPVTFQDSFVNAYGAEHRRARGRIAPTFLPRRVESMRPLVQATADRLVAALGALAPGESVDLRTALSRPLTLTVICDLFGVPDGMRVALCDVIDQVLDSSLDEERALAAQRDLDQRLGALLAHKRAHPAADLTSDLLLSDRPGEQPLADPELTGTLFTMITGGFETAVNLITSAVLALLTHPEQLARVRAGTIGWADVVEETLRVEGPVMHVPMRYAIEDIDLGEGVVIGKGDPIVIGFAAAGRDPEAHPDRPDQFDPTRADKSHLAFGYGPHFCVGAPLARLEADIALTTLFGQLPELALARPGTAPPRLPTMIINGPAELAVVPRPGSSAG